MRTTTRALAALFVLLGTAPISIGAQQAGELPRVLHLPSSVRAMALGDAYATSSGHSDAVFYHPAALAGASGFGLEVQRWETESNALAASAAVGWFGGTVGIGLQTLQFGGPGTGAAAAPAGQDHLFSAGPASVSESVASLGFAKELFGIDVGVVTKLAEERIDARRSATVLFDAGVATDLGPFRAALSYQNLGADLTMAGTDIPAPERITLGIGAYGQQVGIFDLGLAARVSREGDDFVPGAGFEVGYWPVVGRTFVARAGARRVIEGDMSPFSFGFAYWGDDLTVEWAFHPSDGAPSGTHRFGIRFR